MAPADVPGVSNRIWLVVGGFIGFLTFSRLIFCECHGSSYTTRPARQGTSNGYCPSVSLADASLPSYLEYRLSPAKPVAAADTTSPYASTNSLLTARDYLNASTSDPAPFDFCPVFGPGDEVAERRGQWGLLKARLHTGSGARVQRVLQKAMAGMPVTISVLGGSGGSTISRRKRNILSV